MNSVKFDTFNFRQEVSF